MNVDMALGFDQDIYLGNQEEQVSSATQVRTTNVKFRILVYHILIIKQMNFMPVIHLHKFLNI